MRTCLAILAGVLAAGCVTARPDQPHLPVRAPELGSVVLRIETHESQVVALHLDEYVRGAVLPEAALADLDRPAAMRVAQLQAILARTYALANRRRHHDEGFDLCSTTHCQLYRPVAGWPEPAVRLSDEAVRTTAGLIVRYGDTPINAVFHADCGGHTSDAETVWQGSTPPYLQGLPDAYCPGVTRSPWRFTVAAADLTRVLNADPDTRVGNRLDEVVVIARDDAGRAASLLLRGTQTAIVRGEQLRAAVAAYYGALSIKSTRFTVERTMDGFLFKGHGFGHGVGLCQTGAARRALAGHSVEDILTHYYPGATLGPVLSLRSVSGTSAFDNLS